MKKIIIFNIFAYLVVASIFGQDSGNMWIYDYGSNTYNANIKQVSLGSLTENVSNPNLTGINPTLKIGKFEKKEGIYSSMRFDLNDSITTTTNLKFKVKIYLENKTDITNNYVTLILRKNQNTSNQISITNVIQASEKWIEYTYDLSGTTMKELYYNQLYLFFAIPDNDFNATGFTYYFDALQGPDLLQPIDTEKELVNVFPEDGVAQTATTGFTFTKDYLPSGSTWSIRWDESHVYNSLFKYEHPTNPDKSYELRIGKGGQIYSFKGSFGESIPPQYRSENTVYGTGYAPWVDEVWQLVAVDTDLNAPDNDEKYFIHQSGVYLQDSQNLKTPFFSPQIASNYNEKNQEYTTVNWGQQAHIHDNLSAKFTSSLLYYTKYKNVGNGIIQVDYLIYNFGEDSINYLNVPWGGVRTSSLDYTFVSNPDNSYNEFVGLWSDGFYQLADTNGWVAFSKGGSSGNGSSLGLLTNNDEGRVRVGDTNLADGDARDYTVYEGSKVNVDLTFGKTIRIRNYYILDSSIDNIKDQVAASNLQSNSFYGADDKLESEVIEEKYFFEQSGDNINKLKTNNSNGLSLKLQPYSNSYPLFIVKGINENSRTVSKITSDLYSFSDLPYDGKQQDIQLIGFSNSKKQITLENTTICSGDNYTFPDGTTKTNIDSETIYLSNLGTDINGYMNFIQTTIEINESNPCALSVPKLNETIFKLYPNPTVNEITIIGKAIQRNNIFSLTSSMGLDVTSQTILLSRENEKIILDLGKLPSGIYFFRIGTSKAQMIVKK